MARKSLDVRDPDRPEPGCFMFRPGKDAPRLPTRVLHGPPKDPVTGETLDRSWRWLVLVAGLQHREPNVCPIRAGAMQVWLYGQRITREQHDRALAEYRRRLQQPGSGVGDHTRRIDLFNEPPPF